MHVVIKCDVRETEIKVYSLLSTVTHRCYQLYLLDCTCFTLIVSDHTNTEHYTYTQKNKQRQ